MNVLIVAHGPRWPKISASSWGYHKIVLHVWASIAYILAMTHCKARLEIIIRFSRHCRPTLAGDITVGRRVQQYVRVQTREKSPHVSHTFAQLVSSANCCEYVNCQSCMSCSNIITQQQHRRLLPLLISNLKLHSITQDEAAAVAAGNGRGKKKRDTRNLQRSSKNEKQKKKLVLLFLLALFHKGVW
jgi:hypothetical protein